MPETTFKKSPLPYQEIHIILLHIQSQTSPEMHKLNSELLSFHDDVSTRRFFNEVTFLFGRQNNVMCLLSLEFCIEGLEAEDGTRGNSTSRIQEPSRLETLWFLLEFHLTFFGLIRLLWM